MEARMSGLLDDTVRDGGEGLMLHRADDPDGPADIVSGERLASALRTDGHSDSARGEIGRAHV